MGSHACLKADVIVWVDSVGYHKCAYKQKSSYAGIIGRINQYYKDSGKTLMLISPGRIGTSSPELGVTVSFSDISNFSILCEYEDAEIGFIPELSYGSHMFQDIVETNMFYIAIMDLNTNIHNYFNKNLFTANANGNAFFRNDSENLMEKILPEQDGVFEVIKVFETDENHPFTLYADFEKQKVIGGFFEDSL